MDNLRRALEECGVRQFLSSCDLNSMDEASFDTHHRSWCGKIMSCLKNLKVENVTFGRAAKLVAIHVKSVVVLGGKHETALAGVAHPPIDRTLLRRVAEEVKGARLKWKSTSWTTLDQDDYSRLIRELRTIIPEEPFWMLEQYWTGTDE